MKIPWWLHRTLLILSVPGGVIIGCLAALYGINFVQDRAGHIALALYPAGFLLGALLPRLVFYHLIHARCPVDGKKMAIERVVLEKRYSEEITRTGKRYHCKTCGTTR